ncbi:MAG: serine protease [Parcubacteria group bacterium]
MDDLNKNQIVLLTLLISFVTSIATGIMTTSLLQEAPVEITRNINRIVEKTIETVTPSSPVVSGQKEVTTVVVKEEDLIVDSIDKNLKSIVRIKESDGVTGAVSFYGVGLVVNKDGVISADRKTIIANNIYTVTMSDGKEFKLVPTGVNKQTDFILFKAVLPEKDPKDKKVYVFEPVIFAENEPKLGQTIISIGGDDKNTVAVGRVVGLNMRDLGVGTTSTKFLSGIETDIVNRELVGGSPAFNLSGSLIGIKLSSDPSKVFVPISTLKKDIQTLLEGTKSE